MNVRPSYMWGYEGSSSRPRWWRLDITVRPVRFYCQSWGLQPWDYVQWIDQSLLFPHIGWVKWTIQHIIRWQVSWLFSSPLSYSRYEWKHLWGILRTSYLSWQIRCSTWAVIVWTQSSIKRLRTIHSHSTLLL